LAGLLWGSSRAGSGASRLRITFCAAATDAASNRTCPGVATGEEAMLGLPQHSFAGGLHQAQDQIDDDVADVSATVRLPAANLQINADGTEAGPGGQIKRAGLVDREATLERFIDRRCGLDVEALFPGAAGRPPPSEHRRRFAVSRWNT